MIDWISFVTRRRISVEAFLSHHGLNTREKFISHLSEIGVAPPAESTISSLFPPKPLSEVNVEREEAVEEGTAKEDLTTSRSSPHKGNGNSRATSRTVPAEDRGVQDTRARRDL